MTSCIRLLVIFLIAAGISIPKTDALGVLETLQGAADYIAKSLKNLPGEILYQPQNTNSSIQYLLFRPDQPKTPCYIEPNQDALKQCPFDSSLPLKILVHGFQAMVHPMGPFLKMKDEMFKNKYQYNVIVVNWGKYNQQPYFAAAANTVLVGIRLANLIQYLQKYADMDPKLIHLVGHSLGAHLSGVAGKNVPNLGRITGLDPASRLFYPTTLLHRLGYSDANFVDVIHSSNSTEGYGEHEPVGDLDFYPNGGNVQPQCLDKPDDARFSKKRSCNHSAAIKYFTQSIDTSKCRFLASKCNNYTNFLKGICPSESTPMAEMGLPAKPISGLPPKSKFYLRTSPDAPYCLQDGYESPKRM